MNGFRKQLRISWVSVMMAGHVYSIERTSKKLIQREVEESDSKVIVTSYDTLFKSTG